MKKDSQKSKILLIAYNKGYRIDEFGKIINPKKKIISGSVDKHSYPNYLFFSLRINNKIHKVAVHKLQAYQKYGNKLFECEAVRHLNGNSLDNSIDNIAIGSAHDNWMDIKSTVRMEFSRKGTESVKIKNRSEIGNFYNQCKSYKLTMSKFGISRGTLFNIMHGK